jgi:uncharacterized membrane protein YcaP (DUF421 family)
MELISVAITSLGSLVVLFILTKIMGEREIGELSMFDYIVSITIGSIAAEMATELEHFEKPLVAMIVYALVSFLIAKITCKSVKLRRFFEGKTLLFYKAGQIYEKNLKKAKIDVDEFLSMCRVSGYFDLEEIYAAFFESNGKLSVIPAVKNRPITVSDMSLNATQNYPLANVIIDGQIMAENLKATGKNNQWIEKQLQSQGIKDIKNVILAACDSTSTKLNIYVKNPVKMDNDIFI